MRRGGYILTLALLMLTFIGAAVAATTTLLTMDARRTSREIDAAQRRQLLIAGIALARSNLADPAAKSSSIDLPDHSGRSHVEIKRAGEESQVDATITAIFAGHLLRETVSFRRDATGWTIEKVGEVIESSAK